MANEAEKTLHKMQQVLTIDATEHTKQRRIKRSSSGLSCRTHTAVNGYCPVH